MWFEILLVLILLNLKKRPNIPRIWVVLVLTNKPATINRVHMQFCTNNVQDKYSPP